MAINTINLAEKYAGKLAEGFTLESVVAGTTSNDFNWDGVQGINIYSPAYQDLVDYTRSGLNRFGQPNEVADTVQYIPVTRDRAFTMTIDEGNYTEQQMVKKAGGILRGEIREKVVPEMDQYALGKFIDHAGEIYALTQAPTAATIVADLSNAMVKLSNKKVPNEGRYIFIGWTNFGLLRTSAQFLGVDALGNKILTKGALGTFMGAEVIPVPDAYLKKGNSVCHFLIYAKGAVILPKKIEYYKIHKNVPGIHGALLEGRAVFEAEVLGAKADGVVAGVAASTMQATPTFSFSSGVLTITSSGATKVKVTVDGSDPRYSKTAIETTSGGTVTLPSGKITAKAVAYDDALFTSAVATDSERTIA